MPQIQTIRKDESMTPKEMALTAAKALDEKKGGDIAAIEITEQTTLADYFVIATGNSNTQINALCGAVEKAMKEQAGLSSRCMPFEQEHLSDTCVCCGRPAKSMVYWGKAY